MRAILAAAILALCAVEAPAEAQQTAKVVKIGFVAPQGRSLPLFDAFQKGLADLGYVEGKNLVIEPRFAEGLSTVSPDLCRAGWPKGRPPGGDRCDNGSGCQKSCRRHPDCFLNCCRSCRRQRGAQL